MRNTRNHKQKQTSVIQQLLSLPDDPLVERVIEVLQNVLYTFEDITNDFQARFEEKFQRYLKEIAAPIEDRLNDYSELVKAYSQQEVDFDKDILPVFLNTCVKFIRHRAVRQAVREIRQEYQKRMKRYEGPIRTITEDKAPFSLALKKQLARAYAQIPTPKDLEDLVLQDEGVSPTAEGEKVLDANLKKDPNKHPVWINLQVELYKILTAKNVTETQTFRLIEQLLKTLIPHLFDVKHGKDAIRLNVKSRLKTQRRA